jgi:hypothetical protein
MDLRLGGRLEADSAWSGFRDLLISWRQRTRRWRRWVLILRAVLVSICLAETCARLRGAGWVSSIAFGVFWGVCMSGLIAWLGWSMELYLLRGGPFRVGDQVLITDGPLAGETGEVLDVGLGDALVCVRIRA